MTAESNPTARYQSAHDVMGEVPEPPTIARQLRESLDLSHAFEAQLGQVLRCNPTDLAAMRHLIESGPMSPSELAVRLGVSTAAATLIVDRLGAAGHAHRARHDSDRRKVVVIPAEESIRAALAELSPLITGIAQIIAELNDAERAIVERFLAQVLGVYRSAIRGDIGSADTKLR